MQKKICKNNLIYAYFRAGSTSLYADVKIFISVQGKRYYDLKGNGKRVIWYPKFRDET